MPRYYFDIHQNLEFYRDSDGSDFANDAEAKMGAVRRMTEVLGALRDLGTETRIIMVAARRKGEAEPFTVISSRITLLDQSGPQSK